MRTELSSLFLLLAVFVFLPGTLQPQEVGTLTGIVRDSASGAPLMGATFLLSPDTRSTSARRAQTDASGRYLADSVPAGRITIMGACPAPTAESRTLLFLWRAVTLSPGEQRQLDFLLPPGLCDRPVTLSVVGLYRGHYWSGYETSLFVPCPAPGVPGRLIGHQRDSSGVRGTYAWVRFRRGVRSPWEYWPDLPRDRGIAMYYVRWRGTLSGPGSFGHMGVSEYEFQVDSILEVRPPGAGDCAEELSRPAP